MLSDSILDLFIEFVCWLKNELVSERVSEREKVLVSVWGREKVSEIKVRVA